VLTLFEVQADASLYSVPVQMTVIYDETHGSLLSLSKSRGNIDRVNGQQGFLQSNQQPCSLFCCNSTRNNYDMMLSIPILISCSDGYQSPK
jgi:hypothetical protein